MLSQQNDQRTIDESYAQYRSIATGLQNARWQWCLETDDGRLIAAAMVVPDGDRRGWFVGFPGVGLTALAMRPLIKRWRSFEHVGPYDVLRAWIRSDDAVAITFARAFNFQYDCGPADSLSPGGYDMSLYMWKKP